MQIVLVCCDPPRSSSRTSLTTPLIVSLVGLIAFFGSNYWGNDDGSSPMVYLVLSVVGYLVLLNGLFGLYRALFNPFDGLLASDKTEPGFRQTEKLIRTKSSLHLKGTYNLNGRRRKTAINFINPRRGILIIGTPGSGKSYFIVEPLIRQLIEKGTVPFIYDFKYPTLTIYAYNHFLQNLDSFPGGTRFCCINFADLSRSHRCNPIDPATIEYNSDAIGISRTLLNSINRTWADRQGDFFVDSPVSFLAALIWFLRHYENGRYCTLPHVIELSKTPYEELFTILNACPETRGPVMKFVQLFRNKTMETLDGQIASVRVPLDLLDSPDIYYVLSGNDLDLAINNPQAPVVCCLASHSKRRVALAPIMSLFVDRLNKQINVDGGYPCALVLDEFATIRATSVLETIATGRSRNITTILSVQDINQLKSTYTLADADQVMNIAGNLICGQVTGETARQVKERFESVIDYKTTVSVNSSDTSVSRSEQNRESISAAKLAGLSSGEFVGVLADDPDAALRIKHFHARLKKDPTDEPPRNPLPVIAQINATVLNEVAEKIRTEILELVASETKRIVNDPALNKFIVKR